MRATGFIKRHQILEKSKLLRDGSLHPLFVGFRQTENAINVPRGEGVWKTVTGLGKVQRRFFDAVTGQAYDTNSGGATSV